MLFPNIIYYLVLIFIQFNIFSVIGFIISIRLQTILNAIFLGLAALKSKRQVIDDYLTNYPECMFEYHNEDEYIEKRVLEAVSELPAAFGYKIVSPNLNLKVHIFSVHPINNNAQRPKNLVAYSTPTGAFNIGNFIFVRDAPSNSPKFGLYHEIGHITFDNSLEYHEMYSYYIFFVISLAWLFATTNNTIFASSLLIALTILTIVIIFESLKVKKTAKVRSEIRADAFAVRFINDDEKKALLNLLHKYHDYFYDCELTKGENAERRIKLIRNLLVYDNDFDSLHSYYWSTQDSSWLGSVPRILFLILSALLAFFSKEITLLLVIVYGVITACLYIYLRYITKKHSALKDNVFQRIRQTNSENLVKKVFSNTDFSLIGD